MQVQLTVTIYFCLYFCYTVFVLTNNKEIYILYYTMEYPTFPVVDQVTDFWLKSGFLAKLRRGGQNNGRFKNT